MGLCEFDSTSDNDHASCLNWNVRLMSDGDHCKCITYQLLGKQIAFVFTLSSQLWKVPLTSASHAQLFKLTQCQIHVRSDGSRMQRKINTTYMNWSPYQHLCVSFLHYNLQHSQHLGLSMNTIKITIMSVSCQIVIKQLMTYTT
jgi:hypothetical protein